MTNFERIKGMNVEELAKFLDRVSNEGYNCGDVADAFSDCEDECYSTLEWLKHEVTKRFKEWLERECDAE